ncbi:MAG TPA: hypothetical protein VK741_25695 [Acetobacteraceae bacterium]|nr:hypothetical protein [Acetobacteraceae bacterium]
MSTGAFIAKRLTEAKGDKEVLAAVADILGSFLDGLDRIAAAHERTAAALEILASPPKAPP